MKVCHELILFYNMSTNYETGILFKTVVILFVYLLGIKNASLLFASSNLLLNGIKKETVRSFLVAVCVWFFGLLNCLFICLMLGAFWACENFDENSKFANLAWEQIKETSKQNKFSNALVSINVYYKLFVNQITKYYNNMQNFVNENKEKNKMIKYTLMFVDYFISLDKKTIFISDYIYKALQNAQFSTEFYFKHTKTTRVFDNELDESVHRDDLSSVGAITSDSPKMHEEFEDSYENENNGKQEETDTIKPEIKFEDMLKSSTSTIPSIPKLSLPKSEPKMMDNIKDTFMNEHPMPNKNQMKLMKTMLEKMNPESELPGPFGTKQKVKDILGMFNIVENAQDLDAPFFMNKDKPKTP